MPRRWRASWPSRPSSAGWGAHDLEKVRREILDEGDGWVIVADGETRGWIEFSKDPEPRYRRVDLDIFIATALHGRGHAREALRLVIRHFIDRGHHRFTIDPAVANERAIGAYASLGFRPIGTMRRYERADDGVWHDNLLMDLLAEELRE